MSIGDEQWQNLRYTDPRQLLPATKELEGHNVLVWDRSRVSDEFNGEYGRNALKKKTAIKTLGLMDNKLVVGGEYLRQRALLAAGVCPDRPGSSLSTEEDLLARYSRLLRSIEQVDNAEAIFAKAMGGAGFRGWSCRWPGAKASRKSGMRYADSRNETRTACDRLLLSRHRRSKTPCPAQR